MSPVATAPVGRFTSVPVVRRHSVLLFSGDSTTSADRDTGLARDLGRGFAFLVSATLQESYAVPTLRSVNRAVAGETIAQLEARFARDLADVQPSIVTLLIGVNDVCRRFESKPHARPAEFIASYRRLVAAVAERCDPGTAVVLMEPFLLAFRPELHPWREPLDELVNGLREFAHGEGLPLIPLDALFAEATLRAPASFWLWDGIHPTPAGCALMARAWLELVHHDPDERDPV